MEIKLSLCNYEDLEPMDRNIGRYWISDILKTLNIRLVLKEISYNEVISIEIA